jgi:hypothetical protein
VKTKALLVSACGVAALALAVPGGLLGWREWRERALLRDLESSEPATRKAAALELGRRKCARAVPRLLRVLERETGSVEDWESYLVAPSPDADRDEEYIPVDGHGRGNLEVHPAARSLRQIGAPAVPALAKALTRAENPMLQLQFIHVLRCLGPDAQAAVPALAKALDQLPRGKGEEARAWVLIHASVTLGLMGERAAEALPALEALVKKHPMDGGWDDVFEEAIAHIAPGSKRSRP